MNMSKLTYICTEGQNKHALNLPTSEHPNGRTIVQIFPEDETHEREKY